MCLFYGAFIGTECLPACFLFMDCGKSSKINSTYATSYSDQWEAFFFFFWGTDQWEVENEIAYMKIHTNMIRLVSAIVIWINASIIFLLVFFFCIFFSSLGNYSMIWIWWNPQFEFFFLASIWVKILFQFAYGGCGNQNLDGVSLIPFPFNSHYKSAKY